MWKDMPTWGLVDESWGRKVGITTLIITRDGDEYRASYKRANGATQYVGGPMRSFKEAEKILLLAARK